MSRKSASSGQSRRNRDGRGPSSRNQSSEHVARRRELAYQAARLMADGQITDFEHARRKAIARAGIHDKRLWPDNEEIQTLLLEQQRIFGGDDQLKQEQTLLQQALAAMNMLADFHPRLVGAALAGTARVEQGLELQLFAESSEEIIWVLIDRGIPWKATAQPFRYTGGLSVEHPVLTFMAGDVPVRLMVLPLNARRTPPLDSVTNRPLRGASQREVEHRLQTNTANGNSTAINQEISP